MAVCSYVCLRISFYLPAAICSLIIRLYLTMLFSLLRPCVVDRCT